MKRLVSAIAVVLMLGGGMGGRASAIDGLGGFVLEGSSTGVSVFFNSPSIPIPATPTMEMSAARSIARLSSGPSGYALASALWPGEVAANAPAYIAQTIRDSGGEGFPDLPNYPVRAETFFPQGPADAASEPAPGASMSSHAEATRTQSATVSSGATVPGAVDLGSVRSSARSIVETGKATAEASGTMSELSIAAGLVKIGSITSFGRATSDGVKAKLEGTVTVSGMTVAGNAVVVDESGVHAGGQDAGPGSEVVNQLARQALAQAGISILLAGPIDVVKGASGSRSVGGLVVRFDAIALKQYFDLLPPEVRDQIEPNQSLTIVFAALTVTAGASTAFTGAAGLPDVPVFPPSSGSVSAGPSDEPFGSLVAMPAVPSVPRAAASPRGLVGGEPAAARAPGFGGIPIGLVGLLLALALLGSAGLRRLVDVAFGSRAAPCPLEDR